MVLWKVLELAGLALNVVGVALTFMFSYPPKDEARQALLIRLSRFALLLVFCGFVLQLVSAILRP